MAIIVDTKIDYSFILQLAEREASFMEYQHSNGRILYDSDTFLSKYAKRFKAFYQLDRVQSIYFTNICLILLKTHLTGKTNKKMLDENIEELLRLSVERQSILFKKLNIN